MKIKTTTLHKQIYENTYDFYPRRYNYRTFSNSHYVFQGRELHQIGHQRVLLKVNAVLFL